MHYAASLRYLNSFLNLERILYHPNNRLWNLDRMKFLLDWFCHPEKNFFPILIAGTKGKGSTGFFLESILVSSKIPVGFYSSPHLEDPRERIRINGKMVSKETWCTGVEKIKTTLAHCRLPPNTGDFTYFEIMTLLALLTFSEAGVKIGIFEAGMGGRLDATNVLESKLVILAPIHLDHEAILGNTIAKIAREKAAIIRRGSDVVVSPQPKEALREIRAQIQRKKARYWPVHHLSLPIGLKGDYQKINASAAVLAAKKIRDCYGFDISKNAVRKGLKNSGWPGRLEMISKNPDILLDGAHNQISIEALVRNLKKLYPSQNRLLIFGTSRDKRSDAMLKTLSRFFDRVVLTPLPNPRSQEIGTLMFQARGLFKNFFAVGNIPEALKLAKQIAALKSLIVITGSFYLIGEARKILHARHS